jgi:MATE family multidrug resistance protein
MVSLAFAAATVAVFLTFPELLVSAFIDPAEPTREGLIAVGVGLLAMAALFQLVDAAQVMALGLLRGVQDTAVPFGMAVISYWVVGMPSSYLLGFTFGFGAVGVWLGLVIGLSVASLLLMVRFWGHSVRISLKHG